MRVWKSPILVSLIAGVLSSGCLIAHSTSVEITGKPVSEELQAQIVVGETTYDWLMAALGEPTRRQPVGEHGEILSYESVTIKERDSAVFLLFGGEKTVRQTTVARFEFTDDTLVRYWTE